MWTLIWVHTVCKNDFKIHKQMTKQTTIVMIGSLWVKLFSSHLLYLQWCSQNGIIFTHTHEKHTHTKKNFPGIAFKIRTTPKGTSLLPPGAYYFPLKENDKGRKYILLGNISLTLEAPRKTTSENVVCLCRLLNILADFSNLFMHTGKQCGP